MSDTPLYPYQEEGVPFLAARKYALLADEPGLGKTVQAIKAAEEVGAQNILVICPKSAIGNWHNEFRFWWPGGPTPKVVNFDQYSVSTPNDLCLSTLDVEHDLVIIDEAHRLKSTGANRTRVIYSRVTPHAERVWLLSGTPTPNHNGELYTHLATLVPEYIRSANGKTMSQRDFEDLYCKVSDHPQFGRRILGNKDTADLKRRIMPFFLRRKKSEVLRDLPPLRFATYPVTKWNAKMLKGLKEDLTGEMPGGLTDDEALDWLRSNEVALATQRRMTGLIKVPGVMDVIEDTFDALPIEQRKVIVFAHHREVMDSLQEKLKGPVVCRIDGRTPSKDRDKAVETFQTTRRDAVFLGQIGACGEALTLTAARDVIFAEFSWTPSENYQAACRAHRIGQRDAVLARFLTLPGSLDEVIAAVAARKTREIAELFG